MEYALSRENPAAVAKFARALTSQTSAACLGHPRLAGPPADYLLDASGSVILFGWALVESARFAATMRSN
jgi:hypothetical protein